MADYTLYYWPLPFRGHFVRYLLAEAGAALEDRPMADVAALKGLSPADAPVPFMAPPVLADNATGAALSQLPAILMYLGARHGLLPGEPLADALTLKVVCDCNDVLEDLTRNCGAQMWDQPAWDAFAATRLMRWLDVFEETGRAGGLTMTGGTLLGTPNPGLADIAACALWHTAADKLPPLRPIFAARAPATMALADRIAARPAIAAARKAWDADHGQAWCGGQIETSIRAVLGA